MPLKTMMLLITLAGDGSTQVHFAEAEDMAACAAKVAAVEAVLAAAGTPILDIRCAASDLEVSPYRRGRPKDAPRYAYRVTLTAAGFEAAAVAEGACTPVRAADRRVVCATSTQRPLAGERPAD